MKWIDKPGRSLLVDDVDTTILIVWYSDTQYTISFNCGGTIVDPIEVKALTLTGAKLNAASTMIEYLESQIAQKTYEIETIERQLKRLRNTD